MQFFRFWLLRFENQFLKKLLCTAFAWIFDDTACKYAHRICWILR